MISDKFVCGYLFDFCGENSGEYYYTQNTTDSFQNTILSDKPSTIEANNYLDYRYELSSPETNPATFAVLWLSDIELDL